MTERLSPIIWSLLILLGAWLLINRPPAPPPVAGIPTPIPLYTRIVGTLTLVETPTMLPHQTIEVLPTAPATGVVQRG